MTLNVLECTEPVFSFHCCHKGLSKNAVTVWRRKSSSENWLHLYTSKHTYLETCTFTFLFIIRLSNAEVFQASLEDQRQRLWVEPPEFNCSFYVGTCVSYQPCGPCLATLISCSSSEKMSPWSICSLRSSDLKDEIIWFFRNLNQRCILNIMLDFWEVSLTAFLS